MGNRTPFQRLLDETVASGLGRALRADGYRKERRTWHRASGDLVRIVNVQASAWNTADVGRFTVNLAVYAPKAEVIAGRPVSMKPKEYQGLLRVRLPRLVTGRDDWWEISATQDPSEVLRDVCRAWGTEGRAWMETHSDAGRLLAALGTRGWLLDAARLALGVLEDREAARGFVRRLLAEEVSESHLERVRDFARRNGLLEGTAGDPPAGPRGRPASKA